eukprot:387574_1
MANLVMLLVMTVFTISTRRCSASLEDFKTCAKKWVDSTYPEVNEAEREHQSAINEFVNRVEAYPELDQHIIPEDMDPLTIPNCHAHLETKIFGRAHRFDDHEGTHARSLFPIIDDICQQAVQKRQHDVAEPPSWFEWLWNKFKSTRKRYIAETIMEDINHQFDVLYKSEATIFTAPPFHYDPHQMALALAHQTKVTDPIFSFMQPVGNGQTPQRFDPFYMDVYIEMFQYIKMCTRPNYIKTNMHVYDVMHQTQIQPTYSWLYEIPTKSMQQLNREARQTLLYRTFYHIDLSPKVISVLRDVNPERFISQLQIIKGYTEGNDPATYFRRAFRVSHVASYYDALWAAKMEILFQNPDPWIFKLSKNPPKIVYHGIRDKCSDLLQQFFLHEEITFAGLLSTTTNIHVARRFAESKTEDFRMKIGFILELQISTNNRYHPIYIMPEMNTLSTSESEWLFWYGTFIVKNVYFAGGSDDTYEHLFPPQKKFTTAVYTRGQAQLCESSITPKPKICTSLWRYANNLLCLSKWKQEHASVPNGKRFHHYFASSPNYQLLSMEILVGASLIIFICCILLALTFCGFCGILVTYNKNDSVEDFIL